jgi:hypothetical protein
MTEDKSNIGDLDPCIPEDYLKDFAAGTLKGQPEEGAIEAHVELCPKCGAKVRGFAQQKNPSDESIQKQLASLKKRQEALRNQQYIEPRPGTLWRTVPQREVDLFGPLVIVLIPPTGSYGNLLTVAEVSEDIPQAIETDMILDPRALGLRFRCMVRAGNIFEIDPKNLKEYLGELRPGTAEKVQEFCELGESFDEDVSLSEIVFLLDSQGNELMRRRGIVSGVVASGEDDARLATLEASKARCAYLHGSKIESLEERRQAKRGRSRFIKWVLPLAAAISAIALGVHHLMNSLSPAKTPVVAVAPTPPKIQPTPEGPKRMVFEPMPLDKDQQEKLSRLALTPSRFELELGKEYWEKKLAVPHSIRGPLPFIARRDPFPGSKPHIEQKRPLPTPKARKTEPIHVAAAEGKRDAMTRLLSEGADMNALDEQGRTPLMLAVQADQDEIVRLLLFLGADTTIKDQNEKTALEIAQDKGYNVLARLIKGQRADLCRKLNAAAREGREHAVNLLIIQGADLKCVENEGLSQ